jgi:hypothetical protein
MASIEGLTSKLLGGHAPQSVNVSGEGMTGARSRFYATYNTNSWVDAGLTRYMAEPLTEFYASDRRLPPGRAEPKPASTLPIPEYQPL